MLTMAEAISLAKELNDMPALTNAIFNSGFSLTMSVTFLRRNAWHRM